MGARGRLRRTLVAGLLRPAVPHEQLLVLAPRGAPAGGDDGRETLHLLLERGGGAAHLLRVLRARERRQERRNRGHKPQHPARPHPAAGGGTNRDRRVGGWRENAD